MPLEDTNGVDTKHTAKSGQRVHIEMPIVRHPSVHSQSSIFSESNKIRCSEIGKILFVHKVVTDQQALDRAMKELQRLTEYDEINKEYLSMELIDSLHDDAYDEGDCCLHSTFKDDLGLDKARRLKAYDIVLHHYYDLDDLDKVCTLSLSAQDVHILDDDRLPIDTEYALYALSIHIFGRHPFIDDADIRTKRSN